MTKEANAESEVLEANASFYRAFTRGDFAAMRELWARSALVACVHPMSPVLIGREAVLGSWGQILREPPPQAMRCDQPVAHVSGDWAMVVCYEGNGDRPAHLAATNVFVLEGGRWRMVHHHASPLGRAIPRPRPVTVN
jgi:ketosteroid isomerase-like protein